MREFCRQSKADQAVSAELARAVLAYDAATGLLRWEDRPKQPRWSRRYAGELVGVVNSSGYLICRLAGANHYVHRLAWLIVTGEWPSLKIDHADGDRLNNRWANLRLATDGQNSTNQKLRADNSSGRKGVSWNSRDALWEAYINADRQRIRLGRFADFDQAASARAAAERQYHGAFSRQA